MTATATALATLPFIVGALAAPAAIALAWRRYGPAWRETLDKEI